MPVARELHGIHKTIRAVRMLFVAVAALAGTLAVFAAVPPPTPIDDTLTQFEGAWSRSSPADVADFFAPGDRPRARASLASAARRNGWADGFPAVESWTVTPLDAIHALADGALAGGARLITRWRANELGEWELTTLVPPRP